MLRFCMLHYRKPDNTEEIKTMQNAYGCGTIQTVWYLDREMTKYDENFAAINAAVAQMDDAIQSIPPTPFFDDLTAEDAALQQTTLYDAARIDGANRFQQALHVTLPSILPTIMVMLILKIGNLLSLGFEKVLLMYTPANSSVSDIIDTYVYRVGLQSTANQYSYATAIGLFSGVIGLILVSSSNFLSRKLSGESIY